MFPAVLFPCDAGNTNGAHLLKLHSGPRHTRETLTHILLTVTPNPVVRRGLLDPCSRTELGLRTWPSSVGLASVSHEHERCLYY